VALYALKAFQKVNSSLLAINKMIDKAHPISVIRAISGKLIK
jgi:hypothetical protein